MPSDGSVRILIGAAADRSVNATFASIEARARKMADNVGRSLGSGTQTRQLGTGAQKAYSSVEAAARKAAQAQSREAARAAAEVDRYARKQQSDLERSARAQDAIVMRSMRVQQHERDLAARQASRTAEKQAREADMWQRKYAYRTAYHGVVRYFPGAIGRAGRLGADIMRGAGVDLSVAGSIGRGVELNKVATQLSNQGFMPNESGPNGQRVAPAELEAQARALGQQNAIDPTKVLGGMMKFIDLTGDLNSAREQMGGLAKLANASNSDLEDMAAAAANVSRQLGDVPDKGRKVYDVLRAIAGQGRLGAIEIKDFATQLPAIAGIAKRFAGDTAENITKLTAFAQLAREGPAKSAAQAATSIGRYADVFQTPQRAVQFRKLGIDVSDAQGKLRDPLSILQAALVKSQERVGLKGLPEQMQKLFGSVMAKRATERLTQAYTEVGGGKAGIDATTKMYEELTKGAVLTQKEIDDDNAARMKTTAARAELFQQRIDKIVSVAAEKVIPAFEKLEPTIEKVVETLADWATFSADHVATAIAIAFAASIARAGIESVLREGIERMLRGGPVGGAGGTGGTTAGGVLGAATVGVAVGGVVAAGIYEGGKTSYDRTSHDINELSKALNAMHGAELRENVGDFALKIKDLKETSLGGGSRGFVDKLLGLSDADIAGYENLVTAKLTEAYSGHYTGQAGGKTDEGIPIVNINDLPTEGPQKPLSADDIGASTAKALKGQVLDVMVKNPPSGPGTPVAVDSLARAPG